MQALPTELYYTKADSIIIGQNYQVCVDFLRYAVHETKFITDSMFKNCLQLYHKLSYKQMFIEKPDIALLLLQFGYNVSKNNTQRISFNKYLCVRLCVEVTAIRSYFSFTYKYKVSAVVCLLCLNLLYVCVYMSDNVYRRY